ncbi:MAG TPA: hypothetical protein PLV25_07650 [Opitutales bacterium]|nr:hypothetical protein [Opitutales bacterium]
MCAHSGEIIYINDTQNAAKEPWCLGNVARFVVTPHYIVYANIGAVGAAYAQHRTTRQMASPECLQALLTLYPNILAFINTGILPTPSFFTTDERLRALAANVTDMTLATIHPRVAGELEFTSH